MTNYYTRHFSEASTKVGQKRISAEKFERVMKDPRKIYALVLNNNNQTLFGGTKQHIIDGHMYFATTCEEGVAYYRRTLLPDHSKNININRLIQEMAALQRRETELLRKYTDARQAKFDFAEEISKKFGSDIMGRVILSSGAVKQ